MLIKQSKPINPLHLLAIAGVALLAMIPAFVHGVFDAHDLVPCHLLWSREFSNQFWSGDWYPRWLLEMNMGLGCPTFFFYAPIPYYFTSLLRPLIFVPDPTGWYELSLGAYLGLAASGITAYLWFRDLISSKAALIGALLYILAPYHLAIDLYARFTYGEFWSFVWFPLLMYFSQKLIERRKAAIVGFAIVEALMIMTHLPSFLVLFPVPVLYILWNTKRKARIQAMTQLGGSVLLSLGLAAIYWIPAMTTQHYVTLEPTKQFIESAFFANNYLFTTYFHERTSFWSYLEASTVLMLGVSICSFLIIRRHPVAQVQSQGRFWVAIAVASFVMQVPLSYPVWLLLPPLQKIELPWRFSLVLTVAMVALATLASISLQPIRIWNRRNAILTIAFFAFGSLLAGLALVPAIALQFDRGNPAALWNQLPVKLLWGALVISAAIVLANLRFPVRLSSDRIFSVSLLLLIALFVSSGAPIQRYLRPSPLLSTQLEVRYDAPAHRPRWMPEELYTLERLPEFVRDRFGTAQTAELRDDVEIQRWQARDLIVETNSTSDRWLTLRQLYYPTWTAMLTKTDETLEVRPSPNEGLLQVKIPSGKHQIQLALLPLLAEQIGQWLSLISSILAICLLIGFRGRKFVAVESLNAISFRSAKSTAHKYSRR